MSDQAAGSFVTPVFTDFSEAFPSGSGVGICLSGGGSRAMACGIGQLQALEAISSGGSSLLDQVDCLVTVSGGGWIGIPFTYLPSTVSDAEFLGTYSDPSALTLDLIQWTSPTWIGAQVSSNFSILDLAAEAVHLASQGVSTHMLWQTMMGMHFLAPYGLFPMDATYQPTSLFSLDTATLQSDVTSPNPALASETASLAAQVSGQKRPYLISVCGMFVSIPGGGTVPVLAPVQCTPVLTGVLPAPSGAQSGNGLAVGGAAVSSFAFNSIFSSAGTGAATIAQSRQWSLMDIVGTSSAAFAATVQGQVNEWMQSPERLAAALRIHQGSVTETLVRAGRDAGEVAASFGTLIAAAETGSFDALKARLGGLGTLSGIVPAYDYWSPATPPPDGTTAGQHFADGGSLDNSGVTSLLLYPEVTKIIAFINTENALKKDLNGNIIIDSQVPPLFGYQPHKPFENPPYVTYASLSEPDPKDLHRFNQVFPSEDFQTLLDNLWASTGGDESVAPIWQQQLTTVENDWFGIPAGRDVTVLWVYLGMSQDWRAAITDWEVRAALDVEMVTQHFPHYGTLDTERSPTEVNLLANLTAWIVLQNEATFTALFE